MEHQMKYEYSSIVDPSTYETHGLCDGIPLRCHHQPELEEIETLRCQEDWRKWVSPLGFYKGGLGPRWNFMAITVPECVPERLGVLGYANELAFLHDDITDIVTVGDAHNDDLRAAFEQGAATGGINHAASGKRAIQAHIAREMLAIHKEQATATMMAWAKFAELGSGRHHDTHFKTEAGYIKYRMIDIGTMFWYGMVTFGMAITIPEDELDLAHELANVAYLNLGLTNDLYSYQKEYETAMALGQDYVVNVIWVLMEEHGISEEEAKQRCRERIKQTIVDFRQVVRDTNARTDVSTETKRYIEGMLYSLSGNLVWSIDCPRYHTWSSYNERQLEWMKYGIPDAGKLASGNGWYQPTKTNGAPVNGESSSVPEKLNGSTGEAETQNHTGDTGLVNVFATRQVEDLRAIKIIGNAQQVVQAPYDYLSSLPSKNIREKTIDALNIWYNVPDAKLHRIKEITKLLHNASLMLDDLEDGSELRRSKPATHTIFGIGQTVNAANYQILRALEEVQSLGDAESLLVFTEELKSLYVGQGLDLHWTSNMICPSVEQYLKMVQEKTGGLFRLFIRLMAVHSTSATDIDLTEFSNDLGQWFQIRDDYQNLISPEYAEQKGFAEDLDEGKFSLPLIHLMRALPRDQRLRNLLTQRRVRNGSTMAHKRAILDMMREHGSFAFTAEVIGALHKQVEARVRRLEAETGVDNLKLRHMINLLAV
ncbi:putative geranylgeranyl diphosphate synthase [Nemania serpens]|nr:putative geranylgeranyl diphosphate synthase [Nemania serpens]